MENVEDNEDEAQRRWGARRHLYSNYGTGKIHGGSYTMRTGVQEQTLKHSTYQISRSFTTCACAIFMGQRNNNKNKPCGSWVLSQWITEQRGREGRHQNESPGVQEMVGRSPRGVWSGVRGVVPERIGVSQDGHRFRGPERRTC